MAKRTEITIETTSVFFVRTGYSRRGWCSQCNAEGEMISLENVAMISGVDQYEVEEWLNSQELHRGQSADGAAMVCLNSWLARVQNGSTR